MPAVTKRRKATTAAGSKKRAAPTTGGAASNSRRAPARHSSDDLPVADRARAALAALEKRATKSDRDGLARFGIPATNALGVKMAAIQQLAKSLGRSHELAEELWKSGVYEARLLAAFVGEPERLTAAQMDRWCRGFDNWGICDTLCFVLFDRSPHAWAMIPKWAARKNEFEKRAAFALLASLAGHDKTAGDDRFLAQLPLIERASDDDRNFVWKGVSWALRRIGGRSVRLHEAAMALAGRLARSESPAARKIGKDAIRDLSSVATKKRLGAKPAGKR
jgi:3-methyladenine DNA glycosylase AlkD